MVSGSSQGSLPTSSSIEHDDGLCALCGKTSICEGRGVVRYDLPYTDPRFGKLFRCPNNPVERDEERRARMLKASNLSALADKRFDNFQVDIHEGAQRQSLALALDNAQRFVREPRGWLLLEGTYGSGKTHLAAAIGSARLAQGDSVLFITSPDLLDHLRAAYAPNSEISYDETFDRVRNADLLILDDLGVEKPSPWAQEKLFQLLNHRYVYQLATVITTNADIDRLDARVRSRLLDTLHTTRCTITAPDYRSFTQNERYQINSMLPIYAEMQFDGFEVTGGATTADERANLTKALEICSVYALRVLPPWLVLNGGAGTGKTHLAAAIANQWKDRGEDVMFITVSDLMDYLRTAYGPEANSSFDQRFTKVRSVPMLVLDDFGSENPSAWSREKLFQIMEYRYITRLPTVITTGRVLDSFDERIQVRIFDRRVSRTCAITARSYVARTMSR